MNFYEQLFCRGRATGEGMTHFERLFAAKFGGSPPPEVREYTGAVPVTITADGTPLIDYIISGNVIQSGTPTPENPIMPQECGERTENLTPNQKITSSTYSVTLTTHPLINALKSITPNEDYTLSWKFASNGSGGVKNQVRLYSASGTLIKILQSGVSFTLNSEETANLGALFCYFGGGNTDGYMDEFMLVEGSTAPSSYIPFGYKIPISSANTTTPVYLGEVETTRRVKKLVLTGEEGWQRTSNGAYYLGSRNCPQNYKKTLTESIVMCTHYVGQVSVTGSAAVQDNNISFYGGSSATYELYIGARSISTLAEFTTYLEQQYAAGTPVTVWYVLANEETGIVNEPLMKIGDYADTLSKAQAGVAIPTNNGSTTVDVDTTVKPSEVYIKYMG